MISPSAQKPTQCSPWLACFNTPFVCRFLCQSRHAASCAQSSFMFLHCTSTHITVCGAVIHDGCLSSFFLLFLSSPAAHPPQPPGPKSFTSFSFANITFTTTQRFVPIRFAFARVKMLGACADLTHAGHGSPAGYANEVLLHLPRGHTIMGRTAQGTFVVVIVVVAEHPDSATSDPTAATAASPTAIPIATDTHPFFGAFGFVGS